MLSLWCSIQHSVWFYDCQLKALGPCIDWSNGAVAFLHSSCWISLLSQLSDTLPASHEPYLFTVESAAQFSKTLKQYNECYCFMLSFTHGAVHSGNKVAEDNQCSDQMLDELEKEYPDMLDEPIYLIWEHQQPFQIPLIDTSKQPAHPHLYPLSSEELIALKK